MPAQPRRRKASRKRPVGEHAKISDRAAKALDLRIAGATYRQIGTQLAVSEKTAYLDVQAELARLDAVIKGKAERLRDLEARRLDTLTVALAPGIRASDPRAVMAAVRVMERRARLFGLDAPTTITAPVGAPLPVTIVHQQVRE
jgi:DNA-binding CsgD family transcriptional regulator